jgi:hypothetical protein
MTPAKVKRRSAKRPAILVQWPKEDPAGRELFKAACKRTGGAPSKVIRQLCDEFSRIALSRKTTDAQDAARMVAARTRKRL